MSDPQTTPKPLKMVCQYLTSRKDRVAYIQAWRETKRMAEFKARHNERF